MSTSGGVGFAIVSETPVGFEHGSRPRAKDDDAAWRWWERRRRQPGMARRNEAVAGPSHDASPTNSIIPLHCKPAEHVSISRLFVCLPALIGLWILLYFLQVSVVLWTLRTFSSIGYNTVLESAIGVLLPQNTSNFNLCVTNKLTKYLIYCDEMRMQWTLGGQGQKGKGRVCLVGLAGTLGIGMGSRCWYHERHLWHFRRRVSPHRCRRCSYDRLNCLWCGSPSHHHLCTTNTGHPVFPQSFIPPVKMLHSMRGDD